MTREDFLQLKQELTNIVVQYEYAQKKSYFFQQSYYIEFSEELEQELCLQLENEAILQAIQMFSDGKDKKEIFSFLEKKKEMIKEQYNHLKRRIKEATEMAQRCSHYTPTDMMQLDEEFMDYCINNHPVIKAHSTEMEKNLYNILSTSYRMGNLTGFRMILKENKDVFTLVNVEEEQYDSIAGFYTQSIQNLTLLLHKMNTSFPLTKEREVTEENAATAEHGKLREKMYALREINKNLHKDLVYNFDEDMDLI